MNINIDHLSLENKVRLFEYLFGFLTRGGKIYFYR